MARPPIVARHPRSLVSVVVVVVTAGAGLYALGGPSGAEAAPACPTSAADTATAVTRARACGARVEVLARRSERDSWNCTNRPVHLYRTGGIAGGVGNGDEGSQEFWRKFTVAQTFLIIDYNFLPSTPDGLTTVGTSQRLGCAAPGHLNATGGVGLSATVRDPDAGSAVRARYEWQDVTAGSPLTALPDTPSVAAPHTFEATLPASALPNGHTIQWRVSGYDNQDQGPFTQWCQFTVDNTPPNRPNIVATQLPAFPGAPPATTQVGTPVEVVFEPGGGDSDVVATLWRWSANAAATSSIIRYRMRSITSEGPDHGHVSRPGVRRGTNMPASPDTNTGAG